MTRVPEPKTGYGDCFLCYGAKHRVYGFPIYDGHAMGPVRGSITQPDWDSAPLILRIFFFMRCDALKMF